MLAQLVRVVGQPQQVQIGHRARVQPRVTHGQPVGDHRRARGLRLQAGDPAGGVHEHVGGRQQSRHLVGEPVHVHGRLTGELVAQLLAQLLVASRQAHDRAHLGHVHQLAYGTRQIAHPPAAAGDDHHPALSGQTQRAASLHRTAWPGELIGDQRAHQLRTAHSGDPLDRAHRLPVHHQMHVDARLRPEEQARQIGDRRHRGTSDRVGAAQARKHDGHGRVRRDDHVRIVLGDAARQRARAEQAQQPPRHPANRRHTLQQPVNNRVRPRHEPQLHPISVLDDRLQQAPHRGEPVDDSHLGRLPGLLDLARQRAGGGGVALTHIGGEDQHAATQSFGLCAPACAGRARFTLAT